MVLFPGVLWSGKTNSYQTADLWVVNTEIHQKRWEITQGWYSSRDVSNSKDERAKLSVEEADAIRRPLLGDVLWPSTECTCLERVCPRFLQTQQNRVKVAMNQRTKDGWLGKQMQNQASNSRYLGWVQRTDEDAGSKSDIKLWRLKVRWRS